MLARMNENSPICASATATASATRNGYRSSHTISSAASGFPTSTTASVEASSAGMPQAVRGSSSIPTETKNETANASRIGSASDAARRL